MLRKLALALTLALAVPLLLPAAAAQGTECVPVPGWRVCVVAHASPGLGSRTGVEAYSDDGHYAELTLSDGTGFFGDYIYLIGFVEVAGTLRTHGGVGFVDRGYDGIYENGCVCGAVQTTFLYLPWGVGFEDYNGNNVPDNVYVEPRL